MNRPFISVIMPVYNTEKYVERAVRSVLDQAYSNFELILINDGSEDNSLEICKRLAKEDGRITIIDKVNEGVSKARNVGIEKAEGEYIIFVDADDETEKNMLEILVNKIQENNSDLVMFGYRYIVLEDDESISNFSVFDSSQTIYENKNIKHYTIESITLNSMMYSVCNKLFKMKIIKDHNIKFIENLSSGEDLLFVLKYVDKINMFEIIDLCLYNYYKYDGNNNLTSKYMSNKIDMARCWIKNLDEFIENIKDQEVLDYASWLKFRWTFTSCANVMYSDKPYLERRRDIKKILNDKDFLTTLSSTRIGVKKILLEKIVASKNITLIYFLSWLYVILKSKFRNIYLKKIVNDH